MIVKLQTSCRLVSSSTEGIITGFKRIRLAFPQNGLGLPWAGLGNSQMGSLGNTLMDDSGSRPSWWMAIGATKYNPPKYKTIPGPWLRDVKKVELYVKNEEAEGSGQFYFNLKRIKIDGVL